MFQKSYPYGTIIMAPLLTSFGSDYFYAATVATTNNNVIAIIILMMPYYYLLSHTVTAAK